MDREREGEKERELNGFNGSMVLVVLMVLMALMV